MHRLLRHPPLGHGAPQVRCHRTASVHVAQDIFHHPSAPPRQGRGVMVGRPMLREHHRHLPFLRPSHGSRPGRVGHMQMDQVGGSLHAPSTARNGSGHPKQLWSGGLMVRAMHRPFHLTERSSFLAVVRPHFVKLSSASPHWNRRPNLRIVPCVDGVNVSLHEVPEAGVDLRGKPAGDVQNVETVRHGPKVAKKSQMKRLVFKRTSISLRTLCVVFGPSKGHGGYSSVG